jgi:competence protein ComEC
MIAQCRAADIVISERRLPPDCAPRWLRLDRPVLARSGGVAIVFDGQTIRTVRGGGKHPWRIPPTLRPRPDPDHSDIAGKSFL